jgi:hypothetical protein
MSGLHFRLAKEAVDGSYIFGSRVLNANARCPHLEYQC